MGRASKRRQAKRTNRQTRERIMTEALRLYPLHFPEVPRYGGCVGLTACVISAAAGHGVSLFPVAGSLSWRSVSRERDDGISPDHFSYQFDGFSNPRVAQCVRQGILPEMHCWATDATGTVVVDASTGKLPIQAERLAGFKEWSAPLPPEWVWCKASKLAKPGGHEAHYRQSVQATRFAVTNFIKPAVSAILLGEPFQSGAGLIIPSSQRS